MWHPIRTLPVLAIVAATWLVACAHDDRTPAATGPAGGLAAPRVARVPPTTSSAPR